MPSTTEHTSEYGAPVGRVIVWDHGAHINESNYDVVEFLSRGHLSFWLLGEKLRGGYALTRIREGDDETWVTKSDEYAEARRNPPDSVVSGRRLDELS